MNIPKCQIIATSKHITKRQIDLSSKRIKQIGFQVEWNNDILAKEGYFAGSITKRTTEIHESFKNPNIKAVFCVTGGYGSIGLLDHLDYNLISKNPKPLIGMSDNTSLLLAINKKTGMRVIHGPSYGNKYSYDDYLTKEILISAIHNKPYKISFDKNNIIRTSTKKIEGELIGGCISLVSTLIGTEYAPITKDKIIFLEDVRETPQSLYNKLMHLKIAGLYKNSKALILGKMESCKDYHDILKTYAISLGIPVLWELDIGHTKRMISLPIGGTASIDFQKGSLKIE